jgi:hypothetical protein
MDLIPVPDQLQREGVRSINAVKLRHLLHAKGYTVPQVARTLRLYLPEVERLADGEALLTDADWKDLFAKIAALPDRWG